jgi:hypothetical protein
MHPAMPMVFGAGIAAPGANHQVPPLPTSLVSPDGRGLAFKKRKADAVGEVELPSLDDSQANLVADAARPALLTSAGAHGRKEKPAPVQCPSVGPRDRQQKSLSTLPLCQPVQPSQQMVTIRPARDAPQGNSGAAAASLGRSTELSKGVAAASPLHGTAYRPSPQGATHGKKKGPNAQGNNRKAVCYNFPAPALHGSSLNQGGQSNQLRCQHQLTSPYTGVAADSTDFSHS